jgi:hypothetical protein
VSIAAGASSDDGEKGKLLKCAAISNISGDIPAAV